MWFWGLLSRVGTTSQVEGDIHTLITLEREKGIQA